MNNKGRIYTWAVVLDSIILYLIKWPLSEISLPSTEFSPYRFCFYLSRLSEISALNFVSVGT